MVVNKVPSSFDTEQVRQRVSEAYEAEVGAVIPHSDEMMTLASAGVFVHRYPEHPVTAEYKLLLTRLLE
jgi:hypothetical protein